jgi:hypothetical protein
MHPMLYCLEVPESVCIFSIVHVEPLVHPMLHYSAFCVSEYDSAEPVTVCDWVKLLQQSESEQ